MLFKTNQPNVLISVADNFHVSIFEGGRKKWGKNVFLHCKQKETTLDWSSDVCTDKS